MKTRTDKNVQKTIELMGRAASAAWSEAPASCTDAERWQYVAVSVIVAFNQVVTKPFERTQRTLGIVIVTATGVLLLLSIYRLVKG